MVHSELLQRKLRPSTGGGEVLARSRRNPLQWGFLALASLVIGMTALDAAPFGPLARHMAWHILVMSVIAPLAGLALLAAFPDGTGGFASGRPAALAVATTSQLILLWTSHAPVVLAAAADGTSSHILMQLSLFAAALWFWLEVFADRSGFRWRALLALAVTGKLFCLLGVLLVFSPRAIYAGLPAAHGHAATFATTTLDDQNLAGLLMVVACPLTYVLAAVIIAARALRDSSAGPAQFVAPIVSRPSKP